MGERRRAPDGYERFRNPGVYRTARTPDAAIHGMLAGSLDAAALYEAAGRVKPLVSEPQDPADLDRALARWKPLAEGGLALGEAFRARLHSRDQESALHAAESLSIMEVRHARAIESARKKGDSYLVARLYAELAELAGKGSLRAFYYREAFRALEELARAGALKRKHVSLALSIHLALGRLREASALLDRVLLARPDDPEFLELLADLRFRLRDYAGLRWAVRRLQATGHLGMGPFAPASSRWL